MYVKKKNIDINYIDIKVSRHSLRNVFPANKRDYCKSRKSCERYSLLFLCFLLGYIKSFLKNLNFSSLGKIIKS